MREGEKGKGKQKLYEFYSQKSFSVCSVDRFKRLYGYVIREQTE